MTLRGVFHLVAGPVDAEAVLERFVQSARFELIRIAGEQCGCREGLFSVWARALKFPSYFGHNWDALWECICDLQDWLNTSRLVILVESADKLFTDLPKEDRPKQWNILRSLLCDLYDESKTDVAGQPEEQTAPPLAIVLQTTMQQAAGLSHLLGVDPPGQDQIVRISNETE